MRRVPVYTLVFILISGLAAFSQIPGQRKVPPAPVVKSENKVDQFMKVVQAAKTLGDVRAAFEQAGFTPNELDELKRKIESSSSAMKRIETLSNQNNAATRTKVARSENATKARLASLRKELAEKQAAEIRAGEAKLRQEMAGSLKSRTGLASRLSADPNVVCAADNPTIKNIYGPIRPGMEFGIDGVGLGSAAGSVDVMVDGHVFRANLKEWTQCHAYAYLSSDIGGVRSGEATVSLRTNSGKEASGTVHFLPTLEGRVEHSKMLSLQGYCCGNHAYWNLFDIDLKNDWYATSAEVTTYVDPDDGGHAEITGEPVRYQPNCRARVVIHAGVSGFNSLDAYVHLYIAGPKGLPHKW